MKLTWTLRHMVSYMGKKHFLPLLILAIVAPFHWAMAESQSESSSEVSFNKIKVQYIKTLAMPALRERATIDTLFIEKKTRPAVPSLDTVPQPANSSTSSSEPKSSPDSKPPPESIDAN